MANGFFGRARIIAEVKLWSPKGERLTRNTWEEQVRLADRIGGMVSIHTNPIWNGSFPDIRLARKLTSKPILAKGFHGSDDEVRQAICDGADYVLCVVRKPTVYQDRCFFEPYVLDDLDKYSSDKHWNVWNSRDLASLMTIPRAVELIPDYLHDHWKQHKIEIGKRPAFSQALEVCKGKLCQASNIKSVEDIHPQADAILVGSHLEEFAASLESFCKAA